MFGGTGSNLFGQKPAGAAGTTGFGAPATQQPTLFGSTPAQPTQTPGLGTGFGLPQTSTAQPGGLRMPTPATTTTSQMFGSGLSSPKPGLTFGAPQQPPLNFGGLGSTPAKTSGLGLFTATTSAGLGQTAVTANFGLGSNATTTTPSLGFNFGSTATSTAPTLGLGTTTTASGLSFGSLTTTTAGLSFGTTSTATGLSFGTTTASFSLPTTAATSTAPALGQPPTSTPLGGLGGLGTFGQTSVATTGAQNPLTSLTASVAPSTQPTNYKDMPIPPEIHTMISHFKKFVKAQKSNVEVSSKPIAKVSKDADDLIRLTMQLESSLNVNKALNRKLRADVARGIQDCEVIQRLSQVQRFPSENTLALDYFRKIVERFHSQLESLTVELKNLEKHMNCKLNPSPFTPEELSITLKRLYDCFVALAGRYQAIHSRITALKMEMRLNSANDTYNSIYF